ncbi:MAG: ABC transporter substrate-binding protein [Coriobacteriales bacterium]
MNSISRRQLLAGSAAAAALGALGLAGCGGSGSGASSSGSGESASLGVAYQYGLSYAPVVIAKEQGLIEAAYKEACGGELSIEWNQMSSGADINTGISSGSIQVGFMGLGPAITGIATGLDYRVFSNISGQEHGLMSNDPKVKGLEDLIGSSKQIALVNIGSFQHMALAKALDNAGLDPHALDSNIVAMAHPDGMSALQSGNVACHLTSSPYIFSERKDKAFHELTAVNEAWTAQDSFIVGVASSALHEDEQLYTAVCTGIERAMEFITDSPEDAAAILCEFDGNTAEEELEYLEQGVYTPQTSKLFEMATFMSDAKFLDKAIASYDDLVYSNVTGD